ncbi:hypothetical protein [Nostoc sp. 'Peltigera membranacea cyanobiont' 210A]|uniref:hypothetical protein n=1 Tax=Nostoc sp. 'Peltigera membranacea cyanobiont' 210A TaxID=2014529 RepID=UPI00117E5F9D|nr:hypothetical protein [Nostoc sp. 'Peltigera membranacea cyanobiont' 210A]
MHLVKHQQNHSKQPSSTEVIYKNKYTDAVGFDFAQPTDRSRVERTPAGKQAMRSVSKSCRNSPRQVFSLSEIT